MSIKNLTIVKEHEVERYVFKSRGIAIGSRKIKEDGDVKGIVSGPLNAELGLAGAVLGCDRTFPFDAAQDLTEMKLPGQGRIQTTVVGRKTQGDIPFASDVDAGLTTQQDQRQGSRQDIQS